MDSTIRDKYLANEILKIGELVEDSTSGEKLKILDRGSNYITVETSSGTVKKKWINEVVTDEGLKTEPEFLCIESGQLKMFGYETKAFDEHLTDFVIEQFEEFNDLYSKHQIVKLLDSAIMEADLDKKYEQLEKVSSFYTKHIIEEPLIIEGFKSEVERMRLAQIIAAVAETEVQSKSPYNTIKVAVAALRKKYVDKKQWEVLYPFFVLCHNAGISGILSTLPYRFDTGTKVQDNPDSKPYDAKLTEDFTQLIEDNLEEFLESFEPEDILETFSEDEYDEEFLTEEQLDEVLSFNSRLSLGRKMKTRENALTIKRVRALTRGATSGVLMNRARRMAETMLKRRMFRKDPSQMTRQDKDRFEAGAQRRKALIARLATKLMGKVRMMQTARLHAHHSGQVANTGSVSHSKNIGAD